MSMDAATYKAKRDVLFKDWEAKLKQDIGFGRDGAVDAEKYFDPANSPRIVFVMKEMYAHPFEPNDLGVFLRTGGRWQSWNNVVRLADVLRSGRNGAERLLAAGVLRLPPVSDSHRKDVLSMIAVMNLKKLPGSNVSDMATVYAHARQYSNWLADQLELLDPDVVVAAGVEIDAIDGLSALKKHPEDWCEYTWHGRKRLFIWTWHPQARDSKCHESYAHVVKVAASRS